MIRLLEPVDDLSSPDAVQIEMFDQKWAISEYAELTDAPAYTCISYAWGKEKTKSPLDAEQLMSSRSIRAIEAAVNVSQSKENWADNIRFSQNNDPQREEVGQTAALKASQAFWVDALCVPTEEPARTACLQNMGEIFSSAHQVIVVLSDHCTNIVRVASHNKKFGSSELSVLEDEAWVDRAWTYQEAVNSRQLYFVGEDVGDAIVSGHDFLNAIMIAIDEYKSHHAIDTIAWEKHRPQLRNLERLLADYLISEYATRSAYQVMSVMDQRISERAEDHFYAMIGSITTSSEQAEGDGTLSPSEYFMRVCERKSDFSFIYSTAPRSETVGQRWRPLEGRFPPVLPNLITFGSCEPGKADATHLSLENMYRLRRSPVGPDGLKSASWFVGANDGCTSSKDVALRILARLRTLGFSGREEYLEFETGFFFPQSLPVPSEDVFAFVSSDIHWVTGGPGLLLRSKSSGIHEFCDVGAFVGKSPKSGEEIKVG
jgi:heterokaryon incompatibility protein (HET)